MELCLRLGSVVPCTGLYGTFPGFIDLVLGLRVEGSALHPQSYVGRGIGHGSAFGNQLSQGLCRPIVDPQQPLEIQYQRRQSPLTGVLELAQRLGFETAIDSQDGARLGFDLCDAKSHCSTVRASLVPRQAGAAAIPTAAC